MPQRVATESSPWHRFVAPRADGLPNSRVVAIFPVIVSVVLLVLVALGISGTSSGALWSVVGDSEDDPALIAGEPRDIRSDEWFVQSGWVISQYANDFERYDDSFPGGADSTIQNDAPSWDWSTAFRPHVWGFLLLPLDNGMAVRWWLPVASVLIGAYLFTVSLNPRRPLLAALVASGALFSPILQWWMLPTTLYPVGWSLLAMTAMVWLRKSSRRSDGFVLAALTAYLTVTMVMSIYIPFIVPAALVVALFGVAQLFVARREVGWRQGIARSLPLLLGWVGSIAILIVWVVSRWETVTAVLSTVYPGTRLTPPGSVSPVEGLSILAGPLNATLQSGYVGVLGPNQSEAASAIPFILLFALPLAWVAISTWRSSRTIEWPVVAVLVAAIVAFAYWFVPGWDVLAHALGLDRTQPSRMRLSLLVLSVMAFALLVPFLDRAKARVPLVVLGGATLVTVGYLGLLLFSMRALDPQVTRLAFNWPLVYAAILTTVVALLLRRPTIAGAAFALAGLIVSGGVNPLYKGVIDLASDTATGRAVERIDAAAPGAWVAMDDGPRPGILSNLGSNLLFETGVETYGGMQTYPSDEMWRDIDPAQQYEQSWNRLAQTYWLPSAGEPVVTSPFPDRIEVTFDSCSAFAQDHVSYVLSETPMQQGCLRREAVVVDGRATFYIWSVTAPVP